MNEVLNFLTEARIFFFATTDGNNPRVRPFGFAMDYQGKLYFCTGKQKPVYHQLVANPHFEVCAMKPNGQWLRLAGKAVFDSSNAALAKAFEIMPNLADIYQSPDNPNFTVFYITEGTATITSFTEQPRTIKLA